jgi:hypothetical protein
MSRELRMESGLNLKKILRESEGRYRSGHSGLGKETLANLQSNLYPAMGILF